MSIGDDWVVYDDDEVGASGLGSSAPDTANDDEALRPVVMVAVLPMPPVVTGAGFLGSSAPDTASDDEAGADFLGSSAPDTASDDEALGPVVMEAVLLIPPVFTGAGFLGSSAPDTASNIGLWYSYCNIL